MLGTQLLRLLRRNERSQAWLARKLMVSPMTVHKWAHSKMAIPAQRLRQIRKILG